MKDSLKDATTEKPGILGSSARGRRRPLARRRGRLAGYGALLACTLAIACSDDSTSPASPEADRAPTPAGETLADEVRRLTAARAIGPLRRPAPVRPALVRLGQALLFDPILSGNRDISCMTCHVPGLATGDKRHLSVGQGATGLGPGAFTRTARSFPGTRPRCSTCTS